MRVIFISILDAGWGGSEELWSRTALSLVQNGALVSASVGEASAKHPRVSALRDHGIEIWTRPAWYSRRRQPFRAYMSRGKTPLSYETERLIKARPAALVAVSYSGCLPPISMLESFASTATPFVTICQSNWEAHFYHDDLAVRYRKALTAAARCYFVSRSNLWLTEKQVGGELRNSEVVRNPFNVAFDAAPAWPDLGNGELNFACVGRLEPYPKGQDILFEALSTKEWKARPWRLRLYGEGPSRNGLQWLAKKLGILSHVEFAGFVEPEKIWSSNHVLVMASRLEGLPLAIVEAMLCGRPVIATSVAGNSEIITDGVTGFLADAPTPNAVGATLERFWLRRQEAEQIGKAAARAIRQLLPSDPAKVFAEKLMHLASSLTSPPARH